MATPHVVGAAALILSATPTASPAQVWSTMLASSTPNKVTNPGIYTANGTWTLRVRDAASADTGRINSWTIDP
jgi:subtilisin-like proprotein convertase family protein